MPRKFAYIALATLIVVVGAGLTRWMIQPTPQMGPVVPSGGAGPAESVDAGRSIPLRRPPSSVSVLGVLTRQKDVAIELAKLAADVAPAVCGDAAACEAVRATLADAHATEVRAIPASDWAIGRAELDAGAPLAAGVGRWPTAVVVRVAVAPSPRQLGLRSAFAAAATLAAQLDGWVIDPLLGRAEDAPTFAIHAVTERLDAPAFRADRIRVMEEAAGESVVRLRTRGLARWGAPEVEALAVPLAARDAWTDLMLGVAAAVANGMTSPVSLTRADIEAAAGRPAAGAGSADATATEAVAVDLSSVAVEPTAEEESDFVARIEPPGGEGPLAYLELGERFFGPLLTSMGPPPAASANDAKRSERMLERLASAIDRAASPDAGQLRAFVRLPFDIPGGGREALWVEVTGHDARTVTGRIADDPMAATDVARGTEVTRSRVEVLDVRLR
jgi:hypothetical protein